MQDQKLSLSTQEKFLKQFFQTGITKIQSSFWREAARSQVAGEGPRKDVKMEQYTYRRWQ